MLFYQASRKTKKKEGGAKRAQRASSNVFSMFEQTQIQEFKEVKENSSLSWDLQYFNVFIL